MSKDIPLIEVFGLGERLVAKEGAIGAIDITARDQAEVRLVISSDMIEPLIIQLQTLREDMTKARIQSGQQPSTQLSLRVVAKTDAKIDQLRESLMLRMHLVGGDTQVFGMSQERVASLAALLEEQLEKLKALSKPTPN